MRWPWTTGEPANDDLNARVARLEREVTTIKLEWSEVLDKLLHRLQRQSKRDRDAAVRSLEASGEAITAPSAPQGGVDRSGRLAAIRARHMAIRGNNGRP